MTAPSMISSLPPAPPDNRRRVYWTNRAKEEERCFSAEDSAVLAAELGSVFSSSSKSGWEGRNGGICRCCVGSVGKTGVVVVVDGKCGTGSTCGVLGADRAGLGTGELGADVWSFRTGEWGVVLVSMAAAGSPSMKGFCGAIPFFLESGLLGLLEAVTGGDDGCAVESSAEDTDRSDMDRDGSTATSGAVTEDSIFFSRSKPKRLGVQQQSSKKSLRKFYSPNSTLLANSTETTLCIERNH